MECLVYINTDGEYRQTHSCDLAMSCETVCLGTNGINCSLKHNKVSVAGITSSESPLSEVAVIAGIIFDLVAQSWDTCCG